MKTMFQCDFDGTITEKDVSFLLLDTFTDGSWHRIWREYAEGGITVGTFNQRAFAGVKADKATLLDFMFQKGGIKVRSGFLELLDYCARKDLKFVIVSNGLDFYIEAILDDMGIDGIEVYAARSQFSPSGMVVSYIGPDGREVDDGFKEIYTDFFKQGGNDVIYAGNGMSDLYPARRSRYVFATGDLLSRCRAEKLDCLAFDDLNDIVRELPRLPLA